MNHTLQPPALHYFGTLTVLVAEPIDIGATPEGHRRIVPIIGGSLAGPELNGRVLPAGADFQTLHTAELSALDARYAIEMEDGAVIAVDNQAIRSGPAEALQQIARGEEVDPGKIYFRGTPRLRTSAPQWEWLNRTVFLASGERQPDRVLIRLFAAG